MAQLLFPTDAKVKGPWLLDLGQLEALDRIFDEFTPKLRKERDLALETTIAEEVQIYVDRGRHTEQEIERRRATLREIYEDQGKFGEVRYVTMYLPGGRTLHCQSFSEAASHSHNPKDRPGGFRSYLKVGSIEGVISLGARGDRDLRIEVTPKDNALAQEFFGALENWTSDAEAPKWQQRWLNSKSAAGFLLFLWLASSLLAVEFISEGSAKAEFKDEAQKLLARGLKAEDETRAVELILAISSDYGGTVRRVPGRRFWTLVILGGVFLFSFRFCPAIVIGVWDGKRSLKRWRFWLKSVPASLLLMLVGGLVIPWVLTLVGLLPPH